MVHLGKIIDAKADALARVEERAKDEAESGSDRGPDDDIILGIDLGTTNSSAAYLSSKTKTVEVIPLEIGMFRNRLPSVVWFDQERDRMVIGDEARRAATRYPEAIKAEFKRDMPRASVTTYRLGEGDGARTETPVTLSTAVLAEIRSRAEKTIEAATGKPIRLKRAVITVPATFTEEAPAATMEAAKAAGFEEVQLLDEPTAAALAYALHQGEGRQRIVVFDFGGGTLDCSILTSPGEGDRPFKITNPVGDPELGGKDFDEVLIRLLAGQVAVASRLPPEKGSFDVLSDADLGISPYKRALWRAALKDKAEEIKLQLGEVPTVDWSLSSDKLVDHDGMPLAVDGTVTLAEFEAATAHLVERAVDVLRRTLTEAELSPKDVDRLVVVGGTTMIPAVEAAVARELDNRPYRDVDRLTAVAQGAAIFGLLEAPLPPDPKVDGKGIEVDGSHLDLLASHNFGVRIGLTQLDTLICKNDPLPSPPVTRSYRPARPESEEVTVALYQYDDMVARRAPEGELPTIQDTDFEALPPRVFEIGRVRVGDLRGETRAIDVTFRMDRNRILQVVVRRQSDGSEFPLSIERTR